MCLCNVHSPLQFTGMELICIQVSLSEYIGSYLEWDLPHLPALPGQEQGCRVTSSDVGTCIALGSVFLPALHYISHRQWLKLAFACHVLMQEHKTNKAKSCVWAHLPCFSGVVEMQLAVHVDTCLVIQDIVWVERMLYQVGSCTTPA